LHTKGRLPYISCKASCPNFSFLSNCPKTNLPTERICQWFSRDQTDLPVECCELRDA
jgi:hypothetical protein